MSTDLKTLSIQVEDVVLERGGHSVLKGVSLAVNAPGITAIIGPNGAGKSSLLAVMAGLLPPHSGTRDFKDKDGNPGQMTSIGFMLQKPVLLRRSVKANLHFAMDAAGVAQSHQHDRVSKVLAQLGLLEKADHSAVQLSQGERQRLALARIIAMDAGLMMFDEPTNNLDPATVMLIEKTASHLTAEGRPVIWVSHDLAQVKRIADRVVMMVDGQIEADEMASTFFANPPTSRAAAFIRGDLVTS